MSKINLNYFKNDSDSKDEKRTKKDRKRCENYKKNDFYRASNPEYNSRENREDREIKNKGFAVTDHAIARYYERVEGVNMNALKESIVPDSVKIFICTHKNGELPVKDKYRIRFQNKKVVTIIT